MNKQQQNTRYVKHEDGTITDTKTGLIWSQTLAKRAEFEEAEAAIAALGEGWRMPTVDELQTLVDRTRYDPATDPEAFSDTNTDRAYWSSTPCAWDESAVWVVFFSFGDVDSAFRYYGLRCVRAVRSVPAGQ